MSELGTSSRPLRAAIVGSGPAGFYAAAALLGSDHSVSIDVFDRLPVPFGLVRSGVAPDHPKIKNVIRQYDKIAADENFHFWGNVNVGKDISVDELKKFYDAVILSHGAESDRRLGIPGEDLAGCRTATEFVGWYNCHPNYRDREFDLTGKRAVIIGQGNVAMDVGRILAKTIPELDKTDIAQYALDALDKSSIREISIFGRRGPLQAAFTDKEIKEMGVLDNCDVSVDPAEMVLGEAGEIELADADKGTAKNYSILKEYSERDVTGKDKQMAIRFFRSPVEILGDGKVEAVKLEKTVLKGEPGKRWAEPTGEYEEIPCDILFKSIGYRGEGIEGMPFDEKKAVYPNELGRIKNEQGILPGFYTAGWIKRGPSGVIGTNKPDSVETVKSLLEDLPKLAACENPDSNGLKQLLSDKGVRVISYDDWTKIDAAEVARGEKKGKPREKFVTLEEMISVL